MLDPVVTADGHTYERSAIVDWFQRGKRTSPLTGEPLQHEYLTPNHAARGQSALLPARCGAGPCPWQLVMSAELLCILHSIVISERP
jgi:hypothetical protein